MGTGTTLSLSVDRLVLTFPAQTPSPQPKTPSTMDKQLQLRGGGLSEQKAVFVLRSLCAAPVPYDISPRLPAGVDPAKVLGLRV